ncbi:MAG TPA: hypothetical protein VE085_02070 [Burkholderiales bacterium]|nr:hypothetical protein [Burkholderiales bacterium]
MKRLIEVRSYMEVVAFGPSSHEPDAYFLIRAYAGLADRNAQQEAFYGSDAWKNGPRFHRAARREPPQHARVAVTRSDR